mmetsp:Transcript_23131/g.47093  ORF Transcript_23131/g.47093 Transcript_23131/m.47093 type:complete len:115 (-) Transcript_23131:3572-3916(-)
MAISRISTTPILLVVFAFCLTLPECDAFTSQSIKPHARLAPAATSSTALSVFGKKQPEEDLSYIESRDMTREEMLELNRRNEEVMNRELQAMTGISVLFSIPILYLCWVAFFSD